MVNCCVAGSACVGGCPALEEVVLMAVGVGVGDQMFCGWHGSGQG